MSQFKEITARCFSGGEKKYEQQMSWKISEDPVLKNFLRIMCVVFTLPGVPF